MASRAQLLDFVTSLRLLWALGLIALALLRQCVKVWGQRELSDKLTIRRSAVLLRGISTSPLSSPSVVYETLHPRARYQYYGSDAALL